jgi:predicted nucleic acid-binding protein
MRGVIIDTDIAIDYLRGSQYAKELLISLWDSDKAHLSILSVYELYAGMKKEEVKDTTNFINACRIEPVSLDIAQKAGDIYRDFRTKGITLSSIDCLINATAVIKNYKVATKNIGHYPDKKILLSLS